MNLDPFNMPSYGSSPGARLQGDINTLAPLATSYHGPLPSPDITQYIAKPARPDSGVFATAGRFLGGVGSSIGHISSTVGHWIAKNTVNAVEAPIKLGVGFSHAYLDRSDLRSIQAENQKFSGELTNLNGLWKSGKISNKQYHDGLKNITDGFMYLSREAQSLNNRITIDKKDLNVAGVETASTLVTILTAGFGRAASVALTKGGAVPLAEKTAADYLVSQNANAFLRNVETGVKRIASDPELFARLTPAAQHAIQDATADVLVNTTAHMSAGEIARASVVNLAFKYPVYYNYLSTTGTDIYHELDKKEYGAAVRTTAFNAMLLLSGGPIGQALKYGGKALSGATAKTFGKTAFWDELSKFYGDGSPDGFKRAAFNLASKMKPSEGEAFLKDLSATEATNMNAVGNDAVAAAHRIAVGMKSQRGFGSLTDFTHEEGLIDMANMSRAQRMADEAGRAAGLGPVTVGVTDARSLKGIADAVSGVNYRLRNKTWEALKKSSPSYPWANNPNFDKQVKNLIKQHRSAENLSEAIRNIQASFYVEGFPKAVAKKLSKMGYLPISPVDLQAPFKEGAGKLTTKFADNEDFFVRATQPWPVLGHVGSVITRMGLSPNASTERTYQLFNQNVAANLNETEAAAKVAAALGEGGKKVPEDLSDYMLKKLKSIKTRLPVRDYRMYTSGDIKEALGISHTEAVEVQNAIAKAYFQVPMAVRGLGDKAVDSIYRLRGPRAITGRYLKLQGALRFSWNPFFNYLRLIPKTEILTTAEGGGFLSSVFSGRAARMGQIRSTLHDAGAFEKGGRLGNVVSGEAVEFAGVAERNLSKKLLPMQERSIAGLIGAQADRMGLDWKVYIKNYPDQVRDTVQMIAEYDRKSNFLNSPMARTLNIAFFPFRFETKVATIFARNLGKSSLLTQVSVINGLMRTHDWLNSTEGQVWYSQNSDAIGLFKYITPVASLSEVFQSLLPGHDHHLGNFGELGGLPFGWIPQMLDAEGLTQFHQPGVNPKTGETFPDYVPATAKGQVAIAVQDLIGSIFSYPGATIGLPSKTQLARKLAQGITTADDKDVKKLSDPVNLSHQQLNYSETIHTLAQTNPGQLHPPRPGAPNLEATTVPRQDSSVLHPLPKPVRAGSGTKRKKKADYVPSLLPGQSSLGEL